MSSTVELPTDDAAVEWGKKSASEDEKDPALEKGENSTREGGGIDVNLEGKEQPQIDKLKRAVMTRSFSSVELKKLPSWARGHRHIWMFMLPCFTCAIVIVIYAVKMF